MHNGSCPVLLSPRLPFCRTHTRTRTPVVFSLGKDDRSNTGVTPSYWHDVQSKGQREDVAQRQRTAWSPNRPTLAALNRRVACEPGEPLGSSSSSSSSSVCDVPYVTGVSSVCDVAYVTGRIQELHLAQLLSYPLGTYWQQVCIEW